MILSKDRSYYIGASDTSYVVGNWKTKTFQKWFGVKQGINEMNYVNDSMLAGTFLEHNILKAIDIPGLKTNQQKTKGRLRINLDGNTDTTIYEVKTYNNKKVFKVSKAYREQVCVEMYGFKIKKAYIVSYGLEEEDYKNYYREIDKNRLSYHEIIYDKKFINEIYLPRLKYLSECLDIGKFPNIEEVIFNV